MVISFGFNSSELKIIRKLIESNQELLINKWNEFFRNY